jgi:hypothetical protein
MISTVGVNVQAESDLKVELFGEVKINFVSETLPLERFVDPARLALLQGNARWSAAAPGSAASAPAPTAPASPPPTTPSTIDAVGGAAPIAPATPPAGGER